MSEKNNKGQNGKQPRRFSQQQYDLLKRCSDRKNMTEWNEWRKENPKEDILLEGADLWEADLRKANLMEACLKKANLKRAYLQGAEFGGAELQDADFSRAIVDGETLIWRCKINKNTKFEGVGLDAARIYPKTKQLLECNIRRMNWEEWYKWKDWFEYDPKKKRSRLSQFFLRSTVGWFWWISNYGLSTRRIMGTFLVVSLLFASIYANWACWFPPGIVNGLEVKAHSPLWHYGFVLLLRPIYFSVVTMTTGFSNMYANAQSIWGHILIGIQVFIGYVLLGALVTRFAILFTAGGPAGKFADEHKKDADDKVS